MQNNLQLKDGYFIHHVDASFITKNLFYILHMPIQMKKYEELKNEVKNQGKTIDWTVGMIEKSKMFGMGWIGLADPAGTVKVEGDFIAYKMIGDYKQFKNVWKKIMTDYPKITEAYHIYMTDPNVTKMEENITYIIFK